MTNGCARISSPALSGTSSPPKVLVWVWGMTLPALVRAFCPLKPASFGLLQYNNGMLEMNIPGRGSLHIHHLVSDVNGTLAVDGVLLEGLARKIVLLRDRLTVHLLTADTHGGQALIDRQLNLQAVRIQPGDEARQKADYVRSLGAEGVIALGQGANDAEMLKAAGLGICVLSREGTAVEAMLAADIVMPDVFSAFELLEKPLRIVADLRK
jgi:soluble P-type ATPase